MKNKYNQALDFFKNRKLNKAKNICEEILKEHPDSFDTLHLLGLILFLNQNYHQSANLINKAIKIKSDSAEIYNLYSIVLMNIKKTDEAIENWNKAIQIKPDYAEAYYNLGNALLSLERLNEAIENYNKAIEIKPNNPEAYFNRGNAFFNFNKLNDAIESYNKAIEIKPDNAAFHYNKGNTLIKLNNLEDALESFNRAIQINPDHNYLLGQYIFLKNKLNDWSYFDENLEKLKNDIMKLKNTTMPDITLSIYDSPLLQKISAETYLKSKYAKFDILKPINKENNKKIHLGYYSADFRNHAVSHLIIKLLELHDKSKFKLTGFSLNPTNNINDKMYKRISSAFDQFIHVGSKSDKDIAQISRNLKIDIAIDLMGFTNLNRFGIFLHRCAPIQVNYLGYPGTSGSECMDYIIGDKTVIPKENQKFFSEKIAYMPHTYQANNSTKKISINTFSREYFGLPKNGFVFCCFNQSYKINPTTFDLWIDILNNLNDSVLWLLEQNPKASNNLKKEIHSRGLDASRIIFAKKIPMQDHLARHQFADLFIDSFPYTAHTTCSDALWAGLPVLTLMGNSFSSRVAASLLTAIGLPELVVKTKKEYKDLAIDLATNKEKLNQIKNKLKNKRINSPVFDTKLFTKNIEKLYSIMHQKHQSDLPVDHVEI